MSKRWIFLGGIGLIVFMSALLVRMPAAWLLVGADRLLPVEVGWNQAQGTVSEAVIDGLSFSLPGGRRVYLNKVTFHPAFLSLFSGRLKLDFQLDDSGERLAGSADFGLERWHVAAAGGKLSLSALTPTLPELEIAGLEGRITVRAENIVADYGALPSSGQLVVELENVRTIWLQTDDPLGHYRLHLQALGPAGISGELRTLDGPALLSVTGGVKQEPSSQTLKFSGIGQLSEDAPVPLRRILPILGRTNRDRVAVDWQLALD